MPTTSKVTHQQIAEAVGVSRQLVGFALRGDGNMTDHKRQEILETAKRMGYDTYTNREARAMAARRYGKRVKCGIVALIFDATFEGKPLPTLPYFSPFFQGIESEAVRQELDLVLCPLRYDRAPRLIVEEQVDGFVSMVHSRRLRLAFQEKYPQGLPSVYIGDRVSDGVTLCSDAKDGIFRATEHLIKLGHRCIAFVGVKEMQSARNTHFDGYMAALAAYGLPLEKSLIDCNSDLPGLNGGRDAMQRLMAQRSYSPQFTAVVVYNDLMAMGAVQVLQEQGLKVPADISVTGFDDVSHQYGFSPALTSVRFEREAMGARALALLCQQVDSNDTESLKEYFPVQLVVRDSTQPPPCARIEA